MRAVYRPPFSLGSPIVVNLEPGQSIAGIVKSLQPLPDEFESHGGVVMISGSVVPRQMWGAVRPKAPAELTFHMPIHGGGGGDGGGKDVLAFVAALAITVASGFIAGGGLQTASGALAKGSLGATALAAGVSLAGSLLIGGLISPPVSASDGGRDEDKTTSLAGNVLNANGPIPRVIGSRVLHPPLAAEPYFYFENGEEKVEAVYCLAGPHKLEDIKVDGVPIDEAEDIEFQTREGWNDDADQTILTLQTKIEQSQVQISGHVLDPENLTKLELSLERSDAVPKWHGIATSDSPREFQMQMFLPGGLHRDGSSTDDIRIPFRVRIRKQGDVPWTNGPEIHFMNATQAPIRTTLRFKFESWGSTVPIAPSSSGWIEARKLATGQSDDPETSDYTADAYFSGGAGDDVYRNGTEATTNVENVELYDDEAIIYLDPATFTDGKYEIQIKRGYAFQDTNYSSAAYTYSSNVRDFFWYHGNGLIALDQKNVVSVVHVQRAVSTWASKPIRKRGLALIAIRATNRRVEKLTAKASGYVKDYGGSAWDTWAVTSNPAPHYRDMLVGDLNYDPLPEALVDDTDLVAWRTACSTNGYDCDLVVEGSRLDEALRIVASCGYARPYQSEIWGVVRDYDRSSDSPIQLFTPRNSRGFRFKKAFARLPDGLRVNYPNAAVDGQQSQAVEYHDDANPGDIRNLEQITYLGITNEAKVRQRAKYDLGQAVHRSTFYEMEVPVESIRCRRGDLIGVQHDILETNAGFARITAVGLDGSSDVNSITLDSVVVTNNETELLSVTDVLALTDILAVGARTGVAIRRSDGTVTTHEVSNVTEETATLTFSPSISASPTTIVVGGLVSVGDLGVEYKRLLISSIAPGSNLRSASMVMVDEAPELWS